MQIKAYIGQYEVNPTCPNCFTNTNNKLIGAINNEQAFYCNSCYIAFTGISGGVAQLVDEYKASTGTQDVTFSYTPQYSGGGTITSTLTQSDVIRWSNDLSSINTAVTDSENELSQIKYEIQTLNQKIDTLVSTIEMLVKKNLELQSDPLLGLKKKIQDFNLQ